MKFSEQWLREWINSSLTREELCTRLTMAGLEVEEVIPAAEHFSHVVIGQVVRIEKHPEADRLQICEVDIGKPELLKIVCGAKNVKPGMKVPVALEGALLPNNLKITLSQIRGVTSQGMLCSARELGLAEESEGLFSFAIDAPLGKDARDYLKLADHIIDLSITPNRGDCLSIIGLSMEVSALTEEKITPPKLLPITPKLSDKLNISITIPEECPRYIGRVIRRVKADAETPVEIKERLRRSGIRSISPIVDVMNYVMLELGQPMHAFDLAKIDKQIVVRKARAGEELLLLDGQKTTLNAETMIIADQNKPLAIAGVMGGMDSGVTLLTQDIFLESAYFSPLAIAKSCRSYGLGSESSYRFERGIDPEIQSVAIERASTLLLSIVGGEAGPLIEVSDKKYLPEKITLLLRQERIKKILGFVIPNEKITVILKNLGFNPEKNAEGWQVTIPPRRSDIKLEIDVIEEIIRLYGYEKLPNLSVKAELKATTAHEELIDVTHVRAALKDQDFNEVITYSFIDENLQKLLDPEEATQTLLNPITSEMSVMRTNLWPGLINTLLYNQNRQQNRIRIFETGLRFRVRQKNILQEPVLSGLINGLVYPEQWAQSKREVDFFDLKNNLENVFSLTHSEDEFIFEKGTHPALHPGQTAKIYRAAKEVGIMGALHPKVIQQCDIQGKVFVFEIALEALLSARLPQAKDISKFPEIRRDIAIFVDQAISFQTIKNAIKEIGSELIKEIKIFDVYAGKGVAEGRKSIAFSLFLQHPYRTLVDEEVADLIERVIVVLKEKFAAELRS